jgi:hypothetical protein
MVNPELLTKLIFYSKVVGSVSTIGGLIWAAFNWLKRVSETNRNVNLLITNHFPHVEKTLEDQNVVLQEIKSDVRASDLKIASVSQRLDDTRAGVHTLGESFLRHLEGASLERVQMQAKIIEAVEEVTPANVVVNVAADKKIEV